MKKNREITCLCHISSHHSILLCNGWIKFPALWKEKIHLGSSFQDTISDVDQPINTSKGPLHVPNGPMTRSKTKALKETLNALVLKVSTKLELKGPLEYQEEALVHLIHVQEGPNTTLFGPWGEDSIENKRILLQLGNNMPPFPFVSRIRTAWKTINKPWISSLIFYFLLFFSRQNMDLILGALFYFVTTWKQHEWLPFPFVSSIRTAWMAINKPWISSLILYFLLFFFFLVSWRMY